MKIRAFAIATIAAVSLTIGATHGFAQELTIATNAEPDVLDTAKSGSPQAFTTLSNVYESLTWQNVNGDMVEQLP